MVNVDFQKLFQQGSRQDKFLSRLFAIFSEEIVRCWCEHDKMPYENLGRPYLRLLDERYGKTLDFTLRSRTNPDLVYIAELKCELEYEGYKYLCLQNPEQINHHLYSPAFQRFAEMAKNPGTYRVTIGGRPQQVAGAILIWGCVSDEGRKSIKDTYGFADVLSLEEMVNDMVRFRSSAYKHLVEEKMGWCENLFSGLLCESSSKPDVLSFISK